MHAISSYRGNRPTLPYTNTHTHTHRQDRLQYTAPQLASAQCNNYYFWELLFATPGIADVYTCMIGLPEGPESFKIAVETQYRRVTDRQTDGRTDGRTPHDGEDRAMQNVAEENIHSCRSA